MVKRDTNDTGLDIVMKYHINFQAPERFKIHYYTKSSLCNQSNSRIFETHKSSLLNLLAHQEPEKFEFLQIRIVNA